ncbi:hypothetical protein F6J84_11215 [Microbacterium caowuchunii]|uniref:hypothetical protein n=1 Tax=Microbacterium caowuchunii TaxID=2614638 RepID=UPI001244FE69|nr:hypothetical protein [Microbacterium caowuchunii]QEW00608.1 hypothetical protein F6J84_11215 [Microbacterium caowuchunii]
MRYWRGITTFFLLLALIVAAPAPALAATDTAGPVFVSSSVSASSFNLAKGPARFTVRVSLKDPAGVQTPTITVSHQGTDQGHGFGAMTLVSGDATNGTWERQVTIPTHAAPGQWDVTLYPTSDTLGNTGDFFRTIA